MRQGYKLPELGIPAGHRLRWFGWKDLIECSPATRRRTGLLRTMLYFGREVVSIISEKGKAAFCGTLIYINCRGWLKVAPSCSFPTNLSFISSGPK